MTVCRTGCPTQDHKNWGDCARAANFQIDPDLAGTQKQTTDKRLSSYANAKAMGLQPPTTKLADSQATIRAAGG